MAELPEALTTALIRLEAIIGKEEHEVLGTTSIDAFKRYAVATRNSTYLAALDPDSEQDRTVMAPPLFVTSLMSWGGMPFDDELRPDGLSRSSSPGTEGLNVRQVHGGQRIEIGAPLPSGVLVEATRTLSGAEGKLGRSGPLVLTWQQSVFFGQVGDMKQTFATMEETIVLREGQAA